MWIESDEFSEQASGDDAYAGQLDIPVGTELERFFTAFNESSDGRWSEYFEMMHHSRGLVLARRRSGRCHSMAEDKLMALVWALAAAWLSADIPPLDKKTVGAMLDTLWIGTLATGAHEAS